MGPYQILADIYRAGLLIPEIIVILFTLKMQLAYGTHHTTWGHIRDRIGGPVSSRSNLAPSVMTGYQCGRSLHKNFRSLHKNFQEDHLNSRRFPGFPGGFSNSRRFPGFPGVVDTLKNYAVKCKKKSSTNSSNYHFSFSALIWLMSGLVSSAAIVGPIILILIIYFQFHILIFCLFREVD